MLLSKHLWSSHFFCELNKYLFNTVMRHMFCPFSKCRWQEWKGTEDQTNVFLGTTTCRGCQIGTEKMKVVTWSRLIGLLCFAYIEV